MYATDSDARRGEKLERIEIKEETGTFFNFQTIPQNGQMVQVEVTGPDDTQTFSLFADRPHKHKRYFMINLLNPSEV